MIDDTNKNRKFDEKYFSELYKVFEKLKIKYTLLVRPYPHINNILKLKKFYNILKSDKRDFIFEYELLTLSNFITLLILIIIYPFQTLHLRQKEKNKIDRIFNKSLIEDFNYFSFNSLTRYLFGKNLCKINSIINIYSWCEFQVMERSFNFAIRKNCQHIELVGLQFYLNYEVYFNTHVDDLDYELLSSPHKILVNGKHYILKRKKIKYDLGVSLRYKNIFNFKGIKKKRNILLIGSHDVQVTNTMLKAAKKFKKVIFKKHPTVNLKQHNQPKYNIAISEKNIYKLFESSKLVITSSSGSALEAIACGIPVIIIANDSKLTANPLVKKGKGKMWEVVHDTNEIYKTYNRLMFFKDNHNKEAVDISNWYKNNFFVEPTEKNIIEVFKLNKNKNLK